MKSINSALSLIRWPNLLIIAISMIFILFFVISPILGTRSLVDGMGIIEISLLIVSTLFIAIGGYIVNDVFDINSDSINKQGKNIIGQSITINNAYTLYWITTFIGIISGVLLSYLVNQLNFSLIFVFSAGLLWFYSQKYQCQPVIGNIVIAVLSAISFGLVWLFEFYALSNNAQVFVNAQSNFPLVNRIILIYMGFAFLVSWLREIVKDIEDYRGDNRFGCLTFTVKYGVSASKILALIIGYISLIASIFVQVYFYFGNFNYMFLSFFVIDLIIIVIIYKLHTAVEVNSFSPISLLLKILMLCGILSMILLYFEF